MPNAVDILYAAGFSNNSSTSSSSNISSAGVDGTMAGGAGGEERQLKLTRKDPGLMYMVHSMLNNIVDTLERQF